MLISEFRRKTPVENPGTSVYKKAQQLSYKPPQATRVRKLHKLLCFSHELASLLRKILSRSGPGHLGRGKVPVMRFFEMCVRSRIFAYVNLARYMSGRKTPTKIRKSLILATKTKETL